VPSAGIVTGIGTVRGVVCMIIANDATTKGGSFYKETIRKHVRAQDIAFENRLPVVYLVDCGGANLAQGDEVFPDQDHFGGAFYRQCRMSAQGIPQISAVFGECTAGGAYIPALSDEVVMTAGNSSVHLGGPQIVKAAIKEIVDRETLGGAEMHSTVSGVSDHFARDEAEAIAKTRDIVGALSRAQKIHGELRVSRPPLFDATEIPGIIGADLTRPFDQRDWSTPPSSMNSSRSTARRWYAASRISTGCRLESSPTTGCCSPSPPSRVRISSNYATSATSRSCFCRTSPASWWARKRSAAASPRTPQSWSMRSPMRGCRDTPS
jgi:acetyl-CoA carboxylase carboxyltransferase component